VIDSIKTVQDLVSLGIRFIAMTQNIDTDESKPMGRFLLYMSAFAEVERELIGDRTIAGESSVGMNFSAMKMP
jgi:DNA invertase Pin-like site-specific DNA recombinase